MRREKGPGKKTSQSCGFWVLALALAGSGFALPLFGQQGAPSSSSPTPSTRTFRGETTQDYNQKIDQMLRQSGRLSLDLATGDYRIGPEDLLQISVLEAPDLSRTVRVSADGEISLPLLGAVRAAGLTSRGLEAVLENLLQRSYMKNPQVSVFVEQMKSHPVSVFGAVEKPGVFQIRGPKTLIEVLSMAQGLALDAGDTVIVMRRAGDPGEGTAAASLNPAAAHVSDPQPAADPVGSQSVKISLKQLLDSGDPRYNVLVYPGDVVKVTRAGIVYVVGDVRRPGGFLLKTNENISVLQALALAEGLSPTAAAKNARIIEPGGSIASRKLVAVNLENILKGKYPDRMLESQDILFVPDSKKKAFLHGFVQSMGGIATAVSGAAVYRY